MTFVTVICFCDHQFCITMKQLQKYKFEIAGAILGGIGGYLYYRYVGCAGGACPIGSNAISSTIYFALMGAIFFSLFSNPLKKLKKDDHRSTDTNG